MQANPRSRSAQSVMRSSLVKGVILAFVAALSAEGPVRANLAQVSLVRHPGDALALCRASVDSRIVSRLSRRCFQIAVQEGDDSLASALADNAFANGPEIITTWLLRAGDRAVQEGRSQRATRIVDTLLQHARGAVGTETLIRAGRIYEAAGDPAKAVAAFSEASAREPKLGYGDAWYELRRFHYGRGDWKQVIDSTEPFLDARDGPTSNNWRRGVYLLAMSLEQVGRPDEAVRVYLRLVESPQAPDWPIVLALHHLSEYDQNGQRLDLAAERLLDAYALSCRLASPEPARREYEAATLGRLETLGHSIAASGDAPRLLATLQRRCSGQTGPACYFLLGHVYDALGRAEKAASVYAEACRAARVTRESARGDTSLSINTRLGCAQ